MKINTKQSLTRLRSLVLPPKVSDKITSQAYNRDFKRIKRNIRSKHAGLSHSSVFRILSNLYKSKGSGGKVYGQTNQTVVTTVQPYVSAGDDNPVLVPDLINNPQVPATVQTITLRNYSINEIEEGKRGHTMITSTCKYSWGNVIQ